MRSETATTTASQAQQRTGQQYTGREGESRGPPSEAQLPDAVPTSAERLVTPFGRIVGPPWLSREGRGGGIGKANAKGLRPAGWFLKETPSPRGRGKFYPGSWLSSRDLSWLSASLMRPRII